MLTGDRLLNRWRDRCVSNRRVKRYAIDAQPEGSCAVTRSADQVLIIRLIMPNAHAWYPYSDRHYGRQKLCEHPANIC